MDCVAAARSLGVLNLNPSDPKYTSLAKPALTVLKAKSPVCTQKPTNPTTPDSTKPNHSSVDGSSYFQASPKTQNRISCLSVPKVHNPGSKRVPVSSILQNVRGFAVSETQKWVSSLRRVSDSESEGMLEGGSGTGDYSQSAAFGVALLKVQISPFLTTLAANPTFVSGMMAWMIAQSIKVMLNFFVEKKWDFRMLYASGGMPSSHSALCTALTTAVALCHGVADSLFPVSLGFSLIVMYDAIGVRHHAGMQAKVLNMILEDLFQGHPISQRKLKELLGHTPSQVLAGAVLGIVVSYVCCRGGLGTL